MANRKKILFLGILLLLQSLVFAQHAKLNVVVDERMELLTVVQYLSGYPILNQNENLAYRNDIDRYFAAMKLHPAVLLNKKIYRRYFGFDKPVNWVYHFSFPELKQTVAFTKDEEESYHYKDNSDTLDMLRNELKAFYNRSNFKAFFKAHKNYYDSMIRPVKKELAEYDVVRVMEEHYGERNRSYTIVLCPMLHDGGYALSIEQKGGNDCYAVVGPGDDSAVMGPGFDVGNVLSEYVLHEFSHNFCNPLIDRYFAALEKDSCLFAPIKESMKDQGYGSWKVVLYEYLTRANEVMLNHILLGKETASTVYSGYKAQDWIYLEELVLIIMNQYRYNRDKYKTLDGIMPLVIAYFDKERERCGG